jgi:predicted peroxiredoxin
MRLFYKMHGKTLTKKTKMQKLKHIKYIKLSLILSETVPSLVELSFCRTCPHGVIGDFCLFA